MTRLQRDLASCIPFSDYGNEEDGGSLGRGRGSYNPDRASMSSGKGSRPGSSQGSRPGTPTRGDVDGDDDNGQQPRPGAPPRC